MKMKYPAHHDPIHDQVSEDSMFFLSRISLIFAVC